MLTQDRRKPGRPRIQPAPDAPRAVAAFRYKRIGVASVLQQAWRHPDGLEWRAVETVPEQAPDWEPRHAPAQAE